MKAKTNKIINELHKALIEESGAYTLSFTVYFNSQGYSLKEKQRTAGRLADEGLTMRNMRGEWVPE